MREIWKIITVMAAIFSLIRDTYQACITGQAPFPKIIGGSQDATEIQQIDYSLATDYLVAVGYSKDQGLKGDSSGDAYPIIIAYQSTSYSYHWGKVFTNSQNHRFTGLKINRAGTTLVVINQDMNPRCMIVLGMSTGNVIQAT
ncbi:hypothetical protein FGO68_gene9967 [Halteria grandinella]|uniref:Uncharacterized protein n=1 Tax=Halteria grandinella TaxID=5974 RepID=A0A8J8T958_HALGN|nr:hypothetical protein FGO68_gene9967 [Halteria grandinella]